ncbi:MAG: hypothetical protein COY98_00605, partial [Candidatus Yonathbacteria bacterium CG_4_10_14_0_8_um_filter_43_17]
IGTTTPQLKSVIVSSAYGVQELYGTHSTGAGSYITSATGGHRWGLLVQGSGAADPGGFGIADSTLGSYRMFISSGGNVGIGTTTPGTKLTVAGNIELTLATTGTTNNAVCWDNSGSSLLYDCDSTPADYAESYPTDGTATYGDILMTTDDMVTQTDGVLVPRLAKATASGNIIGIASNNYHDFTSAGKESIDSRDHPIPVALNGRVPVKVNLEGGPVMIGDDITISSVNGVGKKATKTGEVIVGVALGTYNEQTIGDTVLVFVTNKKHLTLADNIRAGMMNVDLATTTDIFELLQTDTTDTIWNRLTSLAKGFINGVLSVTGIKTEQIDTDKLCVGNTCVTETELIELLNR